MMRSIHAVLAALLLTSPAVAAPLALYDDTQNQPIAPLASPAAPVTACGGFTTACSGQLSYAPPTSLPFDYGLSVSAGFLASNHGSGSTIGVQGWIAPKDVPLTLYFDFEHFQSFGRR